MFGDGYSRTPDAGGLEAGRLNRQEIHIGDLCKTQLNNDNVFRFSISQVAF